jgi:hypothetical protein
LDMSRVLQQERSPNKEQSLKKRRLKRRKEFLEQALASIAPGLLDPGETVNLLIGSPARARATLKRAKRRLLLVKVEAGLARKTNEVCSCKFAAPRPTRVLSRLNRSPIFPPVVPEEFDIKWHSLAEVLSSLKLAHRNSPPNVLVDLVATGSGFSFECCAEILLAYGLIDVPIDPDDLAVTRSARNFWNQYQWGRVRYLALVRVMGMQASQGDWGQFENTELEALLPGIIIPTRLKREHYLTNYVVESSYSSLDVYAGSNLAPLFQHRFLQEFNPLFFGKPRREPNVA